jgi:hypothetical protein
MSELGTFAGSAKGLARNPLGIIALFIVLIYGFAALTLGINSSLQAEERLPLVWFLVLFPLVVLFTFGWLVSRHHEKLYAPADYKSDDGFLQGMRVRARHTVEVEAQQAALKAKVLETVTASGTPGSEKGKAVEALVAQLSDEIDRATTISIDASAFLGDPSAQYVLPVAAYETLNDLTDEVFFKLDPNVQAFEYGHSWVLRNRDTHEVIKNARMITGAGPGKPLPDSRSLGEVGIKPGARLIVERPLKPSRGRR